MADLQKLTRDRKAIESQIDRFTQFLHNDQESQNTSAIKARLQKISNTLELFNDIQAKIEDFNESEIDNSTREEFEVKYYASIALAEDLLLTNSNKKPNPADLNHTNIRLPKINLPTFSGNYTDWPSFYDTFKNVIHDNNTITNVQKFYYLESLLSGDAQKLLKGLEITAENYGIAWDLLQNRFNNKKLITHNHIKALVDLPPLNKESHHLLQRLIDDSSMHMRALQALGQPIEYWDTIVIYLLSCKLDINSRRDWETHCNTLENPTLEEFLKLLRTRCSLLETLESKEKPKTKIIAQSHVSTQNFNCPLCKGSQFHSMSPQDRLSKAKEKKLCTNCLSNSHMNTKCKSANTCRLCDKKHNTLLHISKQPDNSQEIGETSLANHSTANECCILLSTAIIYILDSDSQPVKCRALLDSGSQSNFVTAELSKRLGIKRENVNIPIVGISKAQTNVQHKIFATIKSTVNNLTEKLSFLILDRITGYLPNHAINRTDINIPQNIKLADQDFDKPGKIDLLLGASHFWNLLCIGQINLGKNQPILQKTKLGWIIAGSIPYNQGPTTSCVSVQAIDERLERFWQIEEVLPDRKWTAQEEMCEEHFTTNTERDSKGRFVVSLPLTGHPRQLGDSINMATKRLRSLEGKLERDSDLKGQYHAFMNEYIHLGHMTEIPQEEVKAVDNAYYLPHLGVLKPSSLTTKLRVVFDASAKTDTNISLNDILAVGPTLQDDLFSILVRFRKHHVAMTADIAKMYRQINIKSNEKDLQRIIWRNNRNDPIKHYRLNTVTYGTAPASFLATRCLKQIAIDNEGTSPSTSKAINEDFYVDDLLTGANTVEEASQLHHEITSVLKTYGFSIRQWCSNMPQSLQYSEDTVTDYYITDDKCIKALGMLWDCEKDHFSYNLQPTFKNKTITKRNILSTTAQIFDPLGLIGPITIKAKLILQNLWQLAIDWDESIPLDLHSAWTAFLKDIEHINKIRIPRHVSTKDPVKINLHGFCDASEAAYGACIYLQSVGESDDTNTKLICSKSRVAPLKTISIPRLELCGALLLSKLVNKVIRALNIYIDNVYLWCDSTIVLAWISAPPNNWKTFVANRVNEIQQRTKSYIWKHVTSRENPADIISRGITPTEITNNSLWWHGPKYLSTDNLKSTQNTIHCNEADVERKQAVHTFLIRNNFDIVSKFSSFTKMVNVMGYILRFIGNSRLPRESRKTNFLSYEEIKTAITKLIKIAQSEAFPEELNNMHQRKPLKKNSKLLCLDPILDEEGILRVGGRLQNAGLDYNRKHPIIIPNKHPLTTLIIVHEHVKNMHIGTQGTLACIRRKYWPLNGRSAVKREIRKCISCFKCNPSTTIPKMGSLPDYRLQPVRPFYNVGIDYAGPIFIKDGKTRSRKILKSYLCLFICLSTKAVHLELSGDLSTESFLNCLKRFIARRGICANIYSDNGSNFIGANNELKEIVDTVNSQRKSQDGTNFMNKFHIQWHFIPPRAPHFGGIWEAAIKSAKTLLKKVVGNTNLTYESLSTVLTQIEAVLNSRPLLPLSDDPNDLDPLTPSHFLIGYPSTALPEEDITEVPSNRLSKYKALQQMVQHFWKRWSKEYISSLQQRSKWERGDINIPVGSMVLLKDENLPPLQWNLGRVTGIHPGADGKVRVVSVRTNSGVVKRPVVKICVLPIDHST